MKNFYLFILSVLCFSGIGIAQDLTEIQYLSGTGNDNTVKWQFLCSEGRKSGHWTSIEVPSCWEQQGFGHYDYGYKGLKIKDRVNETGLYKRSFKVPKSWKKKEVYIVFEGVMTDAEVKINGKLAGPIHQGAFYRFKYNISSLLKYGQENRIEVFVKKNSDNESVSYAERWADYWVFGGIFRPVFLEVKPKTNIKGIAIDALANGNFKADISISNPKNIAKLSAEIITLEGESLATYLEFNISKKTRISGLFENPLNWSPEFPNLYNIVFKVYDKSNTVVHQYSERIGFRTVEIRESDGIYINGVRVKLKGVSRHTFHPKHGRTSSKTLSIEAVQLMKDMNMNAVRATCYPPDDHFLNACDSLGLFVLDELGGWQAPAYDDVVGKKLIGEMIAKDVNHPSIILWNNGNEGGTNYNLNNDFRELDIQKREVLVPWQDYGKVNTLHYIDYDYLSLDGYSKRKIFLPTEFLHGLYDGGHGAGLDDYWQKMWDNPLCAGGFLWVFADEAIERTDKNNELDTDGNHAPDGIVGPYNEKEGSFFTIKEVWSPIYFEKKHINNQFDGTFRIENRYHFTNLNQCSFSVEWINILNPKQELDITIGKAQTLSLDLNPQQKGILKIDQPNNWQQYDIVKINAIDFYGRKINTWSWPIHKAKKQANKILVNKESVKPNVKISDGAISVVQGQFTYVFNKINGTIISIQKGDKTIPLSNGPVFVSKTFKAQKVKHYFEEDTFIIEVSFEKGNSFKWMINKKGILDLKVAYQPIKDALFAGISFDYPEKKITGMKWLGDGPYRVYKNRMKGVNFGIWEKTYNNTITGESGFEYPEFKGYHSNIYCVQIKGNEGFDFKVVMHSNDIFLRMLTPENQVEPADTKIEYPRGDISFLHGINAIGTKFKKAITKGPQSSNYYFDARKIYGNKLTMDLSFDFN